MKELEIIREIIQDEVGENLSRIILFGSRARGNYTPASDYDLLVILKQEIQKNSHVEVYKNISKKLAKYKIWADLLIKSEEKYNIHSKIIGLCSYEIAQEGIVL